MEYDEFGLTIAFLQEGTIDRHNHLLVSNPFSSSEIELHIAACGPRVKAEHSGLELTENIAVGTYLITLRRPSCAGSGPPAIMVTFHPVA